MDAKLVVGVKDAAASHRAVEWASGWARKRGATIELVAVVGGAIGVIGEGAVVDTALEHAEELLWREAARVREHGVAVTTRLERGNPVEILIAASSDAALLVIGSDYRGVGGPFRGRRGIRIVAAAHCPVVVVPELEPGERSGVVVGIDGSEVSEAALAFAAAEADRRGTELIAVSVWSPVAVPLEFSTYPEDYLANMQTATEEMQAVALAGLASDYPDLRVRRVVESGFPASVIAARGRSAELVVLGSHGRGAFARFLLGSVSEEVLARLPTVTAVVR
ncbi:universal stress protein [Microbacterium limosum]|uniref:Universal stress protein n=1 Tax=Microbacterium limosum TaxID=3079935 RepID=A0AAU0MGB2_9MICO|nr:universal stress protein [Microbacterium sp. Y20]WOQ69204.1 universal stress protein [Microbacterium sp. Y20]